MATSRVQVTEGSGKSLATHSFSEDAVTKEISRVNLNTSGGVETGVAATPLQVSLANTGANATPVVVDLGSNNDITGTVTANLSATDNAVLDAIEADTTTIAGAVAGTEMQVDIVSAPTLTVNAHAVTNAGTFVTQENGALLTAAQLIDDTVATLGTTTYTEATTKGNIIGAVRRDADTTLVDTTNEIGPLQMDANGRLKVEAFSGETLPVSLTSTTVTGTVAVTQSGTWDEVGINDSGNSITVDGTITADLGATDNAVLDAIAASTAAIETAVEGTLTVTGGGGGTEYTEDAAAAANPVGNALILVREDGRAGSLTTTDGDNVALRGNNKGEAYVKTTDSDALLTTIDADTGNISTKIDTLAGAVSGSEVQVDVLTMPTTTVQATNLDIRDLVAASDAVSIGDGTNTAHILKADGTAAGQGALFGAGTYLSVAFTTTTAQAVGTTDAGNYNFVSVHQTSTGGSSTTTFQGSNDNTNWVSVALSQPLNTLSSPSVTGSNATIYAGPLAYRYFRLNITGIASGTTAGTIVFFTQRTSNLTSIAGQISINGTSAVSVAAGASSIGKAEDAAHSTGETGVYTLGVRNDTPNTALTNADADYASFSTDKAGGIRTALYETDFAVLGTNHVKKYYTNAGAVTDGIVWSPAAGKRFYITDIFVNTSAAATVTFEDDKAGGDEVILKAELAANSGWTQSFQTPLFSGEDAADLLVTTSAGNIYITVVGYEI